MRSRIALLGALCACVVMGGAGAVPATADPGGTAPVISQVYGGGGNTGAPYTNDFIELYNPTSSSIPLTGWSVQYGSSGGTTWTNQTNLSGSIPAGGYYLIQEGAGAGNGVPLPTPSATGAIAMSATAGKVALVNTTTALTGTGCPFAASVVDFVGYGAANCSETSPTPALSNTTAAVRNGNGAIDTNNNFADFTTTGGPTPRTSAGNNLSINDLALNEGNSGTTTFSFTVGLSSPAGAGGVTFDIATADGTATTADNDYVARALTGQTIPAGSSTYTFDVLVNGDTTNEPNETFSVNVTNVTGATVADGHGQGTILNDDANLCAETTTPIHEVQGSGSVTPLAGQTVTTRGVVVGDYEGPSPTLRGFYLEDPAGDADPQTSEGIFVFNGNNDNVNLGDSVTVTGTAAEFQDQTQINATAVAVCSTSNSITPVEVMLPFASADYLERYEGMLVRLPQTLYVTEHFLLGRFGQVLMSSGGVLKQPTNVVAPGAPAAALQAQNDLNKIIVDDALQNQNPDPILFGRGGNPLSASNTLRGGDTATGMVGVMTYTWAGNAASGNAYRLRPINALGGGVPDFQPSNPRPPTPPAVGGNVQVGAMNLLNFFNTFGTTACAGGVGGAVMECRGADNQTEFDRQWPKTVAAILGLNADVLGVMEMENDGYGPTSAIQFLVDKLNEATAPGTYAFIDADAGTGQINALGTDAIKVGLLYKPGRVTPVGQTAVLNSEAFVNGGDSAPRSRPSLAQAFELNSNGARFIVDANHLKSKGSACDVPDANDGQANCNAERVNAANELVNWLATNPTGTGDPDILIVGDLNSYAMEDPITAIKNAGYTNLLSQFLGNDAYSYLFDGQFGYLDHALGSASLTSQVSGIGEWHINADEPAELDYNTDFKTPGQVASMYAADQYRMSDHDPVLVGLTLPAANQAPTVDAGGPYTVAEGGSVTVAATGSDPDGDAVTYEWDLDNNGSFETPGQSASFSAATIDGPATRTINVRATDPDGLSDVSSASVTIENVAPTATFTAPASAFPSVAFTISLTNPQDPAPADTFTYAFDCGSGYGSFGAAASRSCTVANTGPVTVRGKIRDDDGDVTEYSGTVVVAVTFDSLCDLTRSYVTDPKVANKLCDILDDAERAAAAGDVNKKQKALDKYVKELQKQSGKTITPDRAEYLIGLASEL